MEQPDDHLSVMEDSNDPARGPDDHLSVMEDSNDPARGPDDHLSVMEDSNDPARGPEDDMTNGAAPALSLDGIGETQTDHQGGVMEDFETQGIHDNSNEEPSQNHMHNIVAHHESDPKFGGSEIDLLVSPRELSLPPITVTSRQQSEDHNSIVSSYVVNGDNNNDNMILPSSCEVKPSETTSPHPAVDDVPVGSIECTSDEKQSQNTHSVEPPTGPIETHLNPTVVTVGSLQDASDGQKSQGDDSLFSSHALLDGIILPSPEEIDHSNETGPEDAKTENHGIRINVHMLPHQRVISSSVESPRFIKQGSFNRSHIDTTAPFESVKDAVSKFGGIVDWKAHKMQSMERRKLVEQELEKILDEMPEYKKLSEEAEEAKVKVLKELDNTKRLIEELKVSLERAETEENQARQDSELALLRMEEREQGIDDEASVAAKTQLEVAKARHEAAASELKSVTDDLEAIRKDYASLMVERDVAAKKAEEAVSASKDVEKIVEELTIELITAKESLESAHAAHLEAEDRRITVAMARDQDTLQWKKELKQGEEEFQRIAQQVNLTKELKTKLDTASALLLDLEAELAAYKDCQLKEKTDGYSNDEPQTTERKPHTDMQAAIASAKKELEEMKRNIERAKMEVVSLRATVDSLKPELEKEKSKLNKTRPETAVVQTEEMKELPEELQRAALEAEKAKSLAQRAHVEFCKAQEEAKQAKDGASIMESRLLVAQRELEAAKVSENLALTAIKALQGSESAQNTDNVDSSSSVTLTMEEYYDLNKRAYDAETQINTRMAAVNSRIEAAKQSQSKSLEKLEKVNIEMSERKEAQRIAMERAEKAKEGKLSVEQELKKLRGEHEHEQEQMAQEPNHEGITQSPSFKDNIETDNIENVPPPADENNKVTEPVPEPKQAKKKKKSLFPKFFMFLSRKKKA